MANFLIIAARVRLNIIISGGTGSGKKQRCLTHCLNILTLRSVLLRWRMLQSFGLMQPHVLRMETRLAGVENTGQITMRSLLINSLEDAS